LPSSLTEDRSSTSGCLPRPTGVGVRYGPCACLDTARGFSWRRCPRRHFRGPLRDRSRPGSQCTRDPDLPGPPAPQSNPPCPDRWADAGYRVPPSPHAHGCRTIHLLAIAYAPPNRRPRLRTRLTLGRLPLPRNPQACGVGGSHTQLIRYSFRHSRFGSLHAGSRWRFLATPERSPTTHPPRGDASAASVCCLSPATLSAQGHSTSELLRTLSRMAASKPTSWLSAHPHHLSH